jgi:hypothetical protein
MIKARKGFIPALLALMTIFVFVPTMAFADQVGGQAVSWGAKYATVNDDASPSHQFKTKRYFDGVAPNATQNSSVTGLITADPQDDTSTIPTTYAPSTNAYFYDLDGSAFTFNGAPIDGKEITQEAFQTQVLGHLAVTLTEPDYAEGYDAKAPKVASFPISVDRTEKKGTVVGLTNWTVDVEMSDYEFNSKEPQTVTFSVKAIEPKHEVDPTVVDSTDAPLYPDLDGTVAEATVKVAGKVMTPQNAQFYFDSKDSVFGGFDQNVLGIYDGAAHTVICDEVEGWTVSYQIYNSKTGKWGDALAVSVTDVDDAVKARAIFKDKAGKQNDVIRSITAKLFPGLGVNIGWDMEASIDDDDPVYGVPGTEYNPADFIATEADQFELPNSAPAKLKKYAEYLNECATKAYEANKETVDAWFNDYYEVKATVSKETPDNVKLQIKNKDLSQEDKKALDEKYAQFKANFGDYDSSDASGSYDYVDKGLYVNTSKNALVKLNYASLNDQVLFTEAPDMTYHVKKAKKLKKTKSFTVAAVAASGKTVSYKMDSSSKKITIDSATGKVTVKKGIKKGTYKVKVIAQTTKGAGYYDAYAVRYLQIKIKK